MTTLVIGGTGQVGSLVVQSLAAKGVSTRVLSRSKDKAASVPGGVGFVVGDLNDPISARAAFDGIEAVFMVNGVSATEANEGLMAATLARKARVRRFVYMSVHHADVPAFLPHFGAKVGIESGVKASGAAWTILRPNNFFQNDLWLREAIVQYGIYPQPIGTAGIHRVDTRDIADAAVNALTTGHAEGRTVALVGPRALSGETCAALLGAALGRVVRYAGDLDQWEQMMKAYIPAGPLFDFKEMFAWFQQHGLRATDAEVRASEDLVGHPLRTYEAFVAELARMWA